MIATIGTILFWIVAVALAAVGCLALAIGLLIIFNFRGSR